MRVIQPCESPGLAGESLFKTRVPGDFRGQDLERDQPVQPTLASLVNRPHSALAKQLHDLEVREMAGKFLGIGRHEAVVSRRCGAIRWHGAHRPTAPARPIRPRDSRCPPTDRQSPAPGHTEGRPQRENRTAIRLRIVDIDASRAWPDLTVRGFCL